jgi:hypothetical protein
MPCIYDTPENLARIAIEEKDKELNRLTKLLCHSCKLLDNNTGFAFMDMCPKELDKELIEWWEDHQEKDQVYSI